MKRVAIDLLRGLQRQYVRSERTAQRVDALLSNRKLTEYDADQIYAGIFLSAFVTYERFIEEVFVGYLLGNVTPVSSKLKPLLTFLIVMRSPQFCLVIATMSIGCPSRRRRIELQFTLSALHHLLR